MADTACARPVGSANSGLISPTKSSRGGSRGETPGSSGRSSVVKNDVKRWKRMHEQNAMLRLTELRSNKKVEVKASKENARKMARKIPIEVLAKDWLSDSEATIEMRAYMVDKVMPTLILGVEKLLNAVDERGLANPEAGGGYNPDFNPLNFLAQYLFRNNPRYSNFSEASPYVRGLRQIAEELKAQLFDMEDNRLARIKAEAKRKREEREKQARLRQQEKERRQQALMTQFAEWNVTSDNNRVELSLLQNALRSFMEVAEQFPAEIQEVAKFGQPIESTDETGRTLAISEFAQYLSMYVETLPSEVFEQFMIHMSKCAEAHRASAERENRRIMLTHMFIFCDHSGIGMLDRHRILNLFEQFWDVYEDSKRRLRNPRRWPVVEVDEVDDTLSDDEDEGVPTIPETAREDQEDTTQDKSEHPNMSGVQIQITSSSEESGEGRDEQGGSGEVSVGSEGDKQEDVKTEETSEAVADDKSSEKEGDKVAEDDKDADYDAGKEVAEDKTGDDKATAEKEIDKEEVKDTAADKVAEDKEDKVEDKVDEAKTAEDKVAEDKAAEDKVAEDKAAEDKVAEDKAGETDTAQTTQQDSTKPNETDASETDKTSPEEDKTENEQTDASDSSQKNIASIAGFSSPVTDSLMAITEEEEEEEEEEEKETPKVPEKDTTDAEKEQVQKEDKVEVAEETSSTKEEGKAEDSTAQSTTDAQDQKDTAAESAAVQEKADRSETVEPTSEQKPDEKEEKPEETVASAEQQPQQAQEQEKAEASAQEDKTEEATAQKEEASAAQEKERPAEQVIQIEDTEEPAPKEEIPEKEAEGAEKKEKEKKEPSADPELAKDTDITGEMAKSAAQPRAPQPTPAATGRVSITFAQGTAFEREKTGLTANSGNRSQSQMSVFDENNVNVSQFVTLTETFLGENPDHMTFEKLLAFLREGYEETEEEKMERLMKARKEAISANRKVQLDTLFEKWDNDGSGYLDLDEVEEVMVKYKEGQEKDTIAKAREELKKQSKYHDSRLSKKEFRMFVDIVIDALPGADAFEYFVEFLANNVERSYAERVRGEARKKWLQTIMTAAETSGVGLDPIYKSVFQALYRDAEAHGGEKRISANIAMMENNLRYPHRGDVLLRYTACTPEDAGYLLNKALYKDMKGISFSAVEQGKPVHVPRVNTHGNIHFWNTDRIPDEREGSFIVVPLKDRKRRVFGILGIDTLADPHSKAIFITHEIQYFQGVAQTFSTAYHLIDMRRKLLRITESAISWIKRRSPHVTEIMVYMVEPGPSQDFVLRRMMTTDSKGFPIHAKDPPVRLERKDNLFRDYLFKSVDNSETVTADAYGNRQLAFPLRNDEGKAIAVVDISTGTLKKLPPHENKEIQRMLRLLQQAHKEITREFAGEDKMQVLDAEKDEETRMDIMFDRLMLMELRDNVAKLDSKAYAELKAYNNPPLIVLHILRATLAIFYTDLAAQGEFDDWNKIKTYITSDLSQKIQAYDPTASEELISPSIIEEYLKVIKNVPHGEVTKHGSLPAQHLYNWVFVCLSLIEHTRKMRQSMEEEALGKSTNEEDAK